MRVHDTTAEPRFERDERQALAPLAARAPFCKSTAIRQPSRIVT